VTLRAVVGASPRGPDHGRQASPTVERVAGTTSAVPLFLGGGAVISVIVWRVISVSRLVGRSSVVLPSNLGEPLVNLRCGARVRGARGEGRFRAISPLATLLVTPERLVVRTAVGDWDFPRESTTVDLDVSWWAEPALHARNGALDARVHLSEDGVRTAIDTMRSAGWTITETARRPVRKSGQEAP
jgi:hypothetical protein